jgi:beta-mannosidase
MRILTLWLGLAFSLAAADTTLWRPYYISPRSGAQHIALESGWRLAGLDRQADSPAALAGAEWIEVARPTSVHMALHKAGKLPHPYYNLNSELYRPAEKKVWYYRRSFTVPESARGQYVFLCFDGADYFARLWLNGELLGRHEGMFGGPDVEISGKLRYGQANDVVLEIRSGNWGNWGKDISRKPGPVIRPWVFAGGSAAEAFYVFGMWRGARVEIVPRAHVERPFLSTSRASAASATLRLSAEIFVDSHTHQYALHSTTQARFTHFLNSNTARPAEALSVRLTLRHPATGAVEFRQTVPATGALRGRTWIERDFTVRAPRLWWPNGLGKPELYQAQVELLAAGKPVDSISFEYGIRTVRTVRSPGLRTEDLWHDWQFEVNGRPFFVKGVNWMPADLLLDLPRQRYDWLVDMARNLGVQMFRIWGAGLVETEDFYAACNRNGVLVWQEFQVSNMLTPDWPQDVWEAQVARNIQRLRNQPSLAVWCGGNEANPYAFANTASIGIFERDVHTFDGTRPYRRTSPDGGSVHEYPDKDPTWYGKEYRFVPFMAETGMHNIPEAASMREVVAAREFAQPLSNMYSPQFAREHPDFRHHFGEFQPSRVPRMLSRASHIDDMKTPTIEALSEASQVGAGEFYQIVSEAIQAQYPDTTGLVPWVYKRPWPIIAIMLADGFGHPTAPYYFLKRTYDNTHAQLKLPALLWAAGESIPLRAAVTHASPDARPGLKLSVAVYDDAFRQIGGRAAVVSIKPGPSVAEADLGSFAIPQGYNDRFLFLAVELRTAAGALVSRSVYWPRALSSMADEATRRRFREKPVEWPALDKGPWLKPTVARTRAALAAKVLTQKAAPGGDTALEVEVRNTGKAPAFMTTVDVAGARRTLYADDNFFWLAPGEARTLRLRLHWREKPATPKLTVAAWNADALSIDLPALP